MPRCRALQGDVDNDLADLVQGALDRLFLTEYGKCLWFATMLYPMELKWQRICQQRCMIGDMGKAKGWHCPGKSVLPSAIPYAVGALGASAPSLRRLGCKQLGHILQACFYP
jgi:hypothetical protein